MNNRYPISPRSFKKALDHFCYRIVWDALNKRTKIGINTLINLRIDSVALTSRYKRNPCKRKSDVKIEYHERHKSTEIGVIDYMQLTYTLENQNILTFKFFIKRHHCKKVRIARWIIPLTIDK